MPTTEELAQLADQQKACKHRVVQPYENEEEDIQVCQECGYICPEGRQFKIKPGRIFLAVLEGFHSSQL